ncbi:MAG: SGNH/GDSL hydrolase family protein [Acidobacteria bacterium]|nr:MAG: SGNH/GDSL hydrolase family protein [Acidobacteriota bacterium]
MQTGKAHLSVVTLAVALLIAPAAGAQSPQQFAPDATRYMALGDSIAAGYKAMPVTEGYAYRLYLGGVFDRIPHTLFTNAAVPGSTSTDVLAYQVPLATMPHGFGPGYITLSVGGNDLLAILQFVKTGATAEEVFVFAQGVLDQFGHNLGAILAGLRAGLPAAKVFVANQYPLPALAAALPVAADLIDAFNAIVAQVVAGSGEGFYLVDVHSAFDGQRNLVEGDRPYASIFEVHPTNVGHRVMAKAFAEVIESNK